MYKVYFDGVAVHDPSLADQTKILVDGKVKKQVNCADSFTFTIYPNNVGYSSLNLMTTSVIVKKDNTILFHGRPLTEDTGWENQKTIVCEGDLALFNDTVMRPYEYTGTVANYINLLVNTHNAQADQSKQITVRTVNVTDSNNNIVRSSSDYVSVLEELMNKTVGTLGGYLITEYTSNGTIYLDYLSDSTSGTNQTLEVGKNILDFQRSLSAEALATALIPLGAADDDGNRLTIKSVNNNQDYIIDANAVSESGTIYTTVTWDDVTVASNLLAKATAALADLKRKVPRIQLSAVDLTNAGANVNAIDFFQYVTVVDTAHNLSGQYLITEREWNLSAPENDTVTFGSEEKTISGATAHNSSAVDSIKDTIINTAIPIVEAQTELLKGGTNGHMVIGTNSNGESNELFFLDTDSVLTARSVLRINQNGIGFSTNGINGPYTTAWTIDGSFNASWIKTGTLDVDDITVSGTLTDSQGKNSWNMATGAFNLTKGTFHVKTTAASNNIIRLVKVDIADIPRIYTEISPEKIYISDVEYGNEDAEYAPNKVSFYVHDYPGIYDPLLSAEYTNEGINLYTVDEVLETSTLMGTLNADGLTFYNANGSTSAEFPSHYKSRESLGTINPYSSRGTISSGGFYRVGSQCNINFVFLSSYTSTGSARITGMSAHPQFTSPLQAYDLTDNVAVSCYVNTSGNIYLNPVTSGHQYAIGGTFII